MTLPLTPNVVEAAYDYLRATSPFKGWKLPPGDEVAFTVDCDRVNEAAHYVDGRARLHTIWISAYNVETTDALMQASAHEMIHAYQDGVLHTGSRRVHHNAAFIRLARSVCRYHGWDVRTFV